MCNGNWVCFACRIAVRRRTWRCVTFIRPWLIGSTEVGAVRCPGCRELCQFIGPTIEIPPKRDLAGWRRLQADVEKLRVALAERRFEESVRRRHALEQRIRTLEERPPSRGRDRLLNELRADLARCK